MSSTASRIMKAFRSVLGRVASQNPTPATSKIRVTSSNPKSEVSEALQKPAPESSDTSLQAKAVLSQSMTSSGPKSESSEAPGSSDTSLQAKAVLSQPMTSSETKQQPPVTSSTSEASSSTSKPVDTSRTSEQVEREAEIVPNNPPNVLTQTVSSPGKPPKSQSEKGVRLTPLKSLKAHVPLIRFRKGQLPASAETDSFGETDQEIKSTDETVKVTLVGLAAMDELGSGYYQSTTNATSQKNDEGSLEWWQTPDKFKRRFIDEKECDIINSGGSDQIFN